MTSINAFQKLEKAILDFSKGVCKVKEIEEEKEYQHFSLNDVDIELFFRKVGFGCGEDEVTLFIDSIYSLNYGQVIKTDDKGVDYLDYGVKNTNLPHEISTEMYDFLCKIIYETGTSIFFREYLESVKIK